MHAEQSLKALAKRFWSLGYSRVSLIVAVVFAVLALASPIWSTTLGTPGASGDWSTTAYTWGSRTIDEFEAGTHTTTIIEYYGGQGFPDPVLASAVSSSYTWIVVYVILLVVVVALFSTEWARTMPPVGLILVSIVTVLLALLALFYPIAAIPGAAAADLDRPITGFWGATSPPPLGWGAGLGWWFLLVAVILGCLGAALPYVRSMRGAPQASPRPWHPSR